jgi:hypothetical protein
MVTYKSFAHGSDHPGIHLLFTKFKGLILEKGVFVLCVYFLTFSYCVTTLFTRYILSANVVVERLTLLLRFRKVPGSNLGPETGYPD